MVNKQVGEWKVYEYKSLHEMEQYLNDTPVNDFFVGRQSSSTGDYSFTHTESYEEALDLLHNGWEDMAKKLERVMRSPKMSVDIKTQRKNVYDVAGYQCCVPRYVNGLPDSMIRQHNVKQKQKVVVINKSIDYSGSVRASTIEEESIKALRIVKVLEGQGMRVELNIVLGTQSGNTKLAQKVRIKAAGERMNISKLAFPMVHPSMLRRLNFRWIEVCPDSARSMVGNYGRPMSSRDMMEVYAGEYVLPPVFDMTDEQIAALRSLDELSAYRNDKHIGGR